MEILFNRLLTSAGMETGSAATWSDRNNPPNNPVAPAVACAPGFHGVSHCATMPIMLDENTCLPKQPLKPGKWCGIISLLYERKRGRVFRGTHQSITEALTMNKKYHCFVLLGIFLILAGTPALATDALPLTGITIDDELKQLLAQVVPYNPQEKGTLPEEKRFMFNLNKLINEGLKEQDEKYKLAATKLALRMALAINRTVDSIEVRSIPLPKVPAQFHSDLAAGTVDKRGIEVWTLGAYSMSSEAAARWGTPDQYEWGGSCLLFTLREGKIIRVDTSFDFGSCGGGFSWCCGIRIPTVMDDKWEKHFDDIGRNVDFFPRQRWR
ncbi:MAG: hypothetical protein FWE95_00465 [Planctomycetaceae bacterium]|nr:hypothetical protein [Planctomycetaceae bacterium]